jgi:hypothetical protein
MNTRRFRIAGLPLAIIGLFLCCSGEPAQAYIYGAAPYYPAYPGSCYGQGGYDGDGYSYGDPYCDGWGFAYGSGGAFGGWGYGNRRGMYGHGSFGRGSRGAAGQGGFSHGSGGHHR